MSTFIKQHICGADGTTQFRDGLGVGIKGDTNHIHVLLACLTKTNHITLVLCTRGTIEVDPELNQNG